MNSTFNEYIERFPEYMKQLPQVQLHLRKGVGSELLTAGVGGSLIRGE